MDVTAQVLHDVEFREAKRGGYNTQDVDEFLERLAAAIERQDAQMREARQRVAAAEQRANDAERRAEDSDGGAGHSDADETLKRTLVLAQRTADAAIREAEERAARTVAAAEDEAARLLTEAHDTSARAYEEAEEEARRAQHEARTRVLAELQELETARDLLRGDIELLEHHIDHQRERLRLSVRELQALLDDPAALRETAAPLLAEVTIPELEPAPQPRRLVAQPLEDLADDEEEAWVDDDGEHAAEGDDDELDEELDDAEPAWTGPDADDYEPVAAPPRSPRDQLRPDPRPLLADARRQAEAEARQREEDAYLAELRKAMTDDEPLGPRDDPDDDYGPPTTSGRSRFGRRR
jgi:DivIVA domain-containing protein